MNFIIFHFVGKRSDKKIDTIDFIEHKSVLVLDMV